MTNPEPCDPLGRLGPGSPKYAKMVTTPGERAAKIRCGSKLEPGSGSTFDVADAGSEAAREGCALHDHGLRALVEPAGALSDAQSSAAAENGGDNDHDG